MGKKAVVRVLVFAFLLMMAAPGLLWAESALAGVSILSSCDVQDWVISQWTRSDLEKELGLSSKPLMVFTGGALRGPTEESLSAACACALLEAFGPDAVNISAADLSGSWEALSAALTKGTVPGTVSGTVPETVPAVSASFISSGNAAMPWKSYVVTERAGKKIVITGIASIRPSQKLDGGRLPPAVSWLEPEKALEKVLPEAEKAGDCIVLLADTGLKEIPALLKKSEKIAAVVISGKSIGTPQLDGFPKILLARSGGLSLSLGQVGGATRLIPLTKPKTENPGFIEAAKTFRFVVSMPTATAPGNIDEKHVSGRFPETIEEGKVFPLGIQVANKAVEMTVLSAMFSHEIGENKLAPDKIFLILDTRWKNIISPVRARDENIPVSYTIPEFRNHLFLIGTDQNGDLTIGEKVPGFLSTTDFPIRESGGVVRGKIGFAIPSLALPPDLLFRVFDYAHGNLQIPLRGNPENIGKPKGEVKRNEIIEGSVFGLRDEKVWKGKVAPQGMTFKILDFRAKSLLTITEDAKLYNPKAKEGETVTMGTLVDWTDYRKYLQLVVDGKYAYAPVAEEGDTETLRFLPEVYSGEPWGFLIPEKFDSLALFCDFPNFKIGEETASAKGSPILFELKKASGDEPPAPSLVTATDEMFKISITAQNRTSTFAGQDMDSPGSFLLWDLTIENTGKSGEFFQPFEQIKLVLDDNSQLNYDEVSNFGPHPPSEAIWVPAASKRAFQVVFKLDTPLKSPRFALTTEKDTKILELK